jgi:hypothetical protein
LTTSSKFRVGREGGERTYPVGGGSVGEAGMATPHAISFKKVGKELSERAGQTSIQIVILSDPPESYTIAPLGVRDHKASGHWADPAEIRRLNRTMVMRRPPAAVSLTTPNPGGIRSGGNGSHPGHW